MRSSSRRQKLHSKAGMSEPRYPSGKSVEVKVTLWAHRDQAAIVGPTPKPGFEVNGQVATWKLMIGRRNSPFASL